MKDREEHWERVYGTKNPTQVSWYAPRLERSLTMIQAAAASPAAILDVGGGASTLVDDLLELGYTVSVLDVSPSALALSKERLGARASGVEWIPGDVTRARLPKAGYDVWHDRAAFHFLRDPAERKAYARQAARSLKPGGQAILASFSLQGPERCSGLDVVRYSAAALSRELGPLFALRDETHEEHLTPSGNVQNFVYCRLERLN